MCRILKDPHLHILEVESGESKIMKYKRILEKIAYSRRKGKPKY
ncbi:MAG: hypothetical protein XD44_0095 [Methanobacteriaceae archaeon 41_258]|nr:MAG: hypothetical protein XD44_0095 [Methanobacteriaceae archaeon 41_258]